MPYIRCKALKEIFLGTKEGTPNSLNPPYPYGDYFIQFGGEGLDSFTDRIFDEIKRIAEIEEGETILIATHGTAIRRFLTVLKYLAEDANVKIGNCGIVKLV